MSERKQRSASKESGHTTRSVSRREILKAAAGTVAVAPLIGLEDVLGQEKGTRRPSGATKGRGAHKETTHLKSRFFTTAELAMVDELAEMIIPTDDHSPGARAAGVAAYLDRRLAELSPAIPEHMQEQQTWRKGLKMVNNISQEMHAGAFMQTTAQQRDAVLRRMAEQEPRSQESRSQEVETQPTETLQTQQSPKSPDDAYRQQSRKSPQQQPSKEALPQHKDEGEFFVFFKGQAARAYYTSEIGLLQELDYKGNQYLQEFAGYDVNGNYTEAPPRRPKDSK